MLKTRVFHVVLGLAGGFAGWLLAEVLVDRLEPRTVLALAVLAVVGLGGALAMLAEIGPVKALAAAAALAPPAAALAWWGAGRFATVEAFFETGFMLVALVVVATFPVPFLMARAAGGRWGWLDYAALFSLSWILVVRIASATAFAGVVWVVLLLSSVLLDLVGVTYLGEALRQPMVIWLLTAGALGLGLAVVAELADLLSPYLLLRLLRLLVPVVLAVVAVFVAVLPMRGLSELFGNISAAGVLMAAAAGSVALISISVDQGEDDAVTGWLMTESARMLAVLVPILGGLAVWAVVLRVGQYGWTPGRVAAATGAGISLAYGVFYALAVLSGERWMERIRRANLAMALALIAIAVAWLTPMFNAEAIAARSQLARVAAGTISAEDLPLWELAHDWGKPGQAALADVRAGAVAPGQDALAARLALLDASANRWQFEQSLQAPDATLARAGEVPVLPTGVPMPDGLWQVLERGDREAVLDGCARTTPGGHAGCLLVLADLVSVWPGDEAIFLFGSGSVALVGAAQSYRQDAGGWQAAGDLRLLGDAPGIGAAAAIDLLDADGIKLVPSGLMALDIGGLPVLLRP